MGSNPGTQAALCRCSFGMTPCPLTVSSQMPVKSLGMLNATITDKNLLFFGTCTSPMHPVVAATGAPGPCLAAAQISAPWISTSRVMIGGKPAINKDSILICNFGGQIKLQLCPAVTVKIG